MALPSHESLSTIAGDRTLTTDRLVMTPHQRGDFAKLAALWANPQVVRFIGGQPSSEEESWARLLRYAGCWAVMGFGFWAVRDRESGAYLGDVGYLEGRRAGLDGFGGDPEIGWCLDPAFHGKGFASEAVRAALGWGAAHLAPQHRRVVAMIHPDNAASVTVAARCNFRHYAVARYKDEPAGLWEYRWPG